MKVDPQVAAHYGQVQPVGGNPKPLSIQELRANADRIYNDAAHFPPIHAAEDLAIPCPWGELPLRLYRPTAERGLPVMIYYHGGGFCIHNIASHDSLCRKLALDCGCAVLSVGYRLAPEDPFPAAVEDCYTALTWLRDNAPGLGLDGSRIALAGDSAGAFLSASVSTLARDRNGPKIALQVLCYGGGELTDAARYPSWQELIHSNPVLSEAFMGSVGSSYQGTADPENPYLNPIRAKDLTGLPRTYSINAEGDPLRDSGEAYARALTEAGNRVRLERVPGVYHGFLLLWQKFDITREVLARIAAEVRDAFAR